MLLVLVITMSFSAGGLSDIEILQGPTDLTVEEGHAARFPCNYSGPSEAPVWYINDVLYVVFQPPPRHTYLYSEKAMVVHNVAISDNGTTYRCALSNGQVNSNTATLTVIPRTKGRFWEACEQ